MRKIEYTNGYTVRCITSRNQLDNSTQTDARIRTFESGNPSRLALHQLEKRVDE